MTDKNKLLLFSEVFPEKNLIEIIHKNKPSPQPSPGRERRKK
jgi:hypothetical protein